LATLNNLIPDIALRLKLTLQQAAGSGLTFYVIIGRAHTKYENFPWGRANTLTGGELVSWETARQIIGENLYYGFKRDMGAARSTLYKSIGYVARELLVKINGERTLLRYASLTGNIKNKQALDRLIEQYINQYMAYIKSVLYLTFIDLSVKIIICNGLVKYPPKDFRPIIIGNALFTYGRTSRCYKNV